MEAQDYTNRGFMIFNVSEVLETSMDTVRISTDGTKTFVKWETSTIPQSIENLVTKEGPYNYSEIMSILGTSEWTQNDIIQ